MDKLMDVYDVAEYLRLSVFTIRAMERNGTLKALRIGRRVLFRPEEIQRFLDDAGQNVTKTFSPV